MAQLFTRSSRICLLIILSLSLYPFATDAQDSSSDRQVSVHEVCVQEGDRCLICNAPLSKKDIVLQYKGRRVPLTKGYRSEFLNFPEKYFWKLQSKGALFTEHEPVANYTLLLVSLGILCLIINAATTASLAIHRTGTIQYWFVLGLLLPGISILYVLLQTPQPGPTCFTRIPDTAAPVSCDHCKAPLHPTAVSCNSCGSKRTPKEASESLKTLQGSTGS